MGAFQRSRFASRALFHHHPHTAPPSLQDGHISEKLSGAVTSVTAAVTDPELLGNVQKGASSLWSKASVVGGWRGRKGKQG